MHLPIGRWDDFVGSDVNKEGDYFEARIDVCTNWSTLLSIFDDTKMDNSLEQHALQTILYISLYTNGSLNHVVTERFSRSASDPFSGHANKKYSVWKCIPVYMFYRHRISHVHYLNENKVKFEKDVKFL